MTTKDIEAKEGCPSAQATATAQRVIDYLEDDARLDTVAGDVIAVARIIELAKEDLISQAATAAANEIVEAAGGLTHDGLPVPQEIAAIISKHMISRREVVERLREVAKTYFQPDALASANESARGLANALADEFEAADSGEMQTKTSPASVVIPQDIALTLVEIRERNEETDRECARTGSGHTRAELDRDTLLQIIDSLTADHRNLETFGYGIARIALSAGIIDGSVPLTGPHLLMLIGDLVLWAESHRTTQDSASASELATDVKTRNNVTVRAGLQVRVLSALADSVIADPPLTDDGKVRVKNWGIRGGVVPLPPDDLIGFLPNPTTQATSGLQTDRLPDQGSLQHDPKCTCFAPPTEQHATYCPREGMGFDVPEPQRRTGDYTPLVEIDGQGNVVPVATPSPLPEGGEQLKVCPYCGVLPAADIPSHKGVFIIRHLTNCWLGKRIKANGNWQELHDSERGEWNTRVTAPVVKEKVSLPDNYICVAPDEPITNTHLQVCLRCQEGVALLLITPPSLSTEAVAREIAEKIVDDLFGNSERLTLSDAGEDKGRSGWARLVVADRITDTLAPYLTGGQSRESIIAEAGKVGQLMDAAQGSGWNSAWNEAIATVAPWADAYKSCREHFDDPCCHVRLATTIVSALEAARDRSASPESATGCQWCDSPESYFPATDENGKLVHRGRDNDAQPCTAPPDEAGGGVDMNDNEARGGSDDDNLKRKLY